MNGDNDMVRHTDYLRAYPKGAPAQVDEPVAYQVRFMVGGPWLECDEAAFDIVNRTLPGNARALYLGPQPAKQHGEPEGWQLVPKEPTQEMLEKTDSYLINPDGEPVDIVRVTKSQYRELLEAAPKFGEEK